MVLIEVVKEEPLAPSDERLLDAKEIEEAAANLERPGARMQLESLAKKLRKEAAALKRVEQSQKAAEAGSATTSTETSSTPEPTTPQKIPAAAPTPAPTPVKMEAAPLPAPSAASSVKFTTVDRFSFDPGEYNSKFVTIYVPLPGVGSIPKDQITCQFTKDSFDLVVKDLKGKSYRLFKDSLEKDIDPEKSKRIVKADKVVIKLQKVKGDYGFDMWSKLTDPNKHGKKKSNKSSNPMSSITEMMKDMYDSGDDEMRRMIGETMLKQRNGELDQNPMGGMGGGGMDDFGDFKDDMP